MRWIPDVCVRSSRNPMLLIEESWKIRLLFLMARVASHLLQHTYKTQGSKKKKKCLRLGPGFDNSWPDGRRSCWLAGEEYVFCHIPYGIRCRLVYKSPDNTSHASKIRAGGHPASRRAACLVPYPRAGRSIYNLLHSDQSIRPFFPSI